MSLTTSIGSIQVSALDPGELEVSCRLLRNMLENAGCVSGDGVAAGGEVHARKVDNAGDNKADEGRDSSSGSKEKAGGWGAVPPSAM